MDGSVACVGSPQAPLFLIGLQQDLHERNFASLPSCIIYARWLNLDRGALNSGTGQDQIPREWKLAQGIVTPYLNLGLPSAEPS